MKDTIYALTRALVCAAFAAAAIWLAFHNGDDTETFKVMAIAVVTYFFAQRSPPKRD